MWLCVSCSAGAGILSRRAIAVRERRLAVGSFTGASITQTVDLAIALYTAALTKLISTMLFVMKKLQGGRLKEEDGMVNLIRGVYEVAPSALSVEVAVQML